MEVTLTTVPSLTLGAGVAHEAARSEEAGRQVGAEQLLPLRQVHVGDRDPRLVKPGRVHQDVGNAERAAHRVERALDLPLVTHIDHDAGRATPVRHDPALDPGGVVAVPVDEKRHVRPRLGQRQRAGRADP